MKTSLKYVAINLHKKKCYYSHGSTMTLKNWSRVPKGELCVVNSLCGKSSAILYTSSPFSFDVLESGTVVVFLRLKRGKIKVFHNNKFYYAVPRDLVPLKTLTNRKRLFEKRESKKNSLTKSEMLL